jgi:hypothetical protein
MKILRSDSHIPSAPAASMNQFQIPKGQNPLRLLFASFRLILGLEKTVPIAGCEARQPEIIVSEIFRAFQDLSCAVWIG